jgi:hypothetical protein
VSIPTGDMGDRDQWMTMFSALDDDAVDALLDGRAVPDSELHDVAEVVERLRATARREPVPPMGAALRAQVRGTHVVPFAPALTAHRSVRRGLVAVVAAATVVLVGVGADQNRLPANVQDVVSSAAELVGVDVPASDERPQAGGVSIQGSEGAGRTDGVTPGGATPADPGEPGDQQPATPATPPEHAGSDNANGGVGVESTPGVTAPGATAPEPALPPQAQLEDGGTAQGRPPADPGPTMGADSADPNTGGNAGGGGRATTTTTTTGDGAP